MKRALAVLLVCSVAAFAQFPAFTGRWDATVCLIGPGTPSLTSSLSLTTKIAGFDITSGFRFTATALDRVWFSGKGALGPFSLSTGMYFNPIVPEYMGGYLSTTFDFAGLGIGFDVYHWDTDYNTCFFYPSNCWPFLDWYDGLETPCPQTGAYGMLYKLSLKVDPVSLKLYFADCCEGIEFDKAILTLKGIGLCCGIALDAEMAFKKEGGFQYLTLSGIEIPLCCGVSLTAKVTFTVDTKTVETGLKFAGYGDACFTVWGDAIKTGNAWTGIEIYGWRIRCTLGDCNYAEFVTALNPTEVNKRLPAADRFLVGAPCYEFEYIKLGFCGPGCCGGKYTVDLSIYFGTGGGIFDITRLNYSVKIPIMANFTLNLSGRVAASTCTTHSFCFGWTFTF